MKLIRGVDHSLVRQSVITGAVGIAKELGITVLAEGTETEAEFLLLLKAAGVRLFQRYWFAKPASKELLHVLFKFVPQEQFESV